MSILIPQKYSFIGIFTSLFMLRASIAFFFYEEKITSIISFISYILTNLHWYKIKKYGIIRKLDILFAISYALYGSYRAGYYDCKDMFYKNAIINISMFFVNEILNTYTLYSSDFIDKSSEYKTITYIRSVVIHTLFLHVLQSENSRLTAIQCNLINY
jgi:hypothetical protein